MRSVVIVGAGKVGTALARAARAELRVRLVGARSIGRPLRPADLVILACRDGAIEAVAATLAPALPPRQVVVHTSGARSPEALAGLRAADHSVGAMHPLVSFAGASDPETLRGAALVITGDAAARVASRRFARAIGMRPFQPAALDPVAYHAAAALTANGAAALAYAARRLLRRAGFPPEADGPLLGPLLASVAQNVTAYGPGRALTGPVRRGDVETVARHLRVAAEEHLEALFSAVVEAQLEATAAQGDVSSATLQQIRGHLLRPSARGTRRGGPRI